MSAPQFSVVVTDFLSEPLDEERRILGDLAEVRAAGAKSAAALRGAVEHADALMLYHFVSLSADTIASLERCRLIVRCGVGVDNIDLTAARERGIPVANVPDYGTEEVADTAIGMALSLARGIHLLNERSRRRAEPWSYTQAVPLHRLRGRVFGIVGCGRIGSAAALRAKTLGMNVAFYDPLVPDGLEKALGIRRFDAVEDLLRASFVLSLHCPLTPETRSLIRPETIALLPPGAIVINTARGAVCEPQAIVDAIASGHLAGAAIDVLPEEPPSPDSPVLAAWRDPDHPASERLILNPHAAFYCEEGLREIRTKASANIRRALLGEPVRNLVPPPQA